MKMYIIAFLCLTYLSFASDDWSGLNGPFGGNLNNIVENNGILYATGYQNKGSDIYKSIDGGNSWVSIKSKTLPYFPPIEQIAVSGDIIIGISSAGMVRSIDGGQNWEYEAIFNIYKSIYHYGGKFYLVAAETQGLRRDFLVSENNGATWTKKGDGGKQYIHEIIMSNSRLIAGTSEGMFVSDDDGSNWTEKNTGIFSKDIFCIKEYQGKIFVGTRTAGVHLSSDNGETWKPINKGLNDYLTILDIESYNGELVVSALSTSNSKNKIFTSTDNGNNWIPNIDIIDGFFHKLVSTSKSVFAATDNYGVVEMNIDKKEWVEKNTFLNMLNFTKIMAVDDNILVGTTNGLFISTDKGNTWEHHYISNDKVKLDDVYDIKYDKGTIFVGSEGLWMTTDLGKTWKTEIFEPLTVNSVRDVFIEDSLIYLSTGYLNYNFSYLSLDYGNNWSTIDNNKITNNTDPNPNGFCLPQGCIKHNNYYYICLADGYVPLLKSNDFKEFEIASKEGLYTSNINSIQKCNDYLIVSSDMGIYRSNDDGEYWEALPNEYSAKSTILSSNGNQLFIKYNDEIATSYDCGNTWHKIYDQQTNEAVSAIGCNKDYVFLGGTSSGTSTMRIPENLNSVDDNKTNIISIYPNPANNFVSISGYSGDLKIINILGAVVWQGTIEDNAKINIADLAKGVYLVKYGDRTMTLIKSE